MNKNQYLKNISEKALKFKIGAFFPIQKYLKDRKGAAISVETLNELENQVKAIHFSVEKMNELKKNN